VAKKSIPTMTIDFRSSILPIAFPWDKNLMNNPPWCVVVLYVKAGRGKHFGFGLPLVTFFCAGPPYGILPQKTSAILFWRLLFVGESTLVYVRSLPAAVRAGNAGQV
jgi:hypothetical protein